MEISVALIAVIGTIFGGAGLKAIEHFLSKNKQEADINAQIRIELRGEAVELKKEIQALEVELEGWRAKYYDLRDQRNTEMGELKQAIADLRKHSNGLDNRGGR